jgi:hypothetical protein
VRLYQDDVPVQVGSDLRPTADPRRFTARVRLRGGLNHFHAMASRPGSIDGSSNTVAIRYDGPEVRGRLHVVALGVSRYGRHALRFADRDAQQMAEFLRRHGVRGDGQPSEPIVLLDDRVTAGDVDSAFAELRRRTRGRPEDTVVVFLAGHSGVLQGRFCLLLPKYPFPEDRPILVGSRSRGSGPEPAAGVDPTVLPYAAIYRHLAHLDALQRLVIIDACQAEAALDDPALLQIRRLAEEDAHRARTAYILAARRGELANEVPELKHGLLTYVLLRGMGQPAPEPVPGVSIFDALPDADFDRDGLVTTAELRRYADLTVPRLAARFPELGRRGDEGAGTSAAGSGPAARVQQGADRPFPIVELPARESRAGDRRGARINGP